MNALLAAARELLKHETAVAETSYRTWTGDTWVFNDDIWEENAPDQFALVKALREALEVTTPTGKPHFAFLVRRAVDSEAWATIFTRRDLAEGYFGRASEVVEVHLLER